MNGTSLFSGETISPARLMFFSDGIFAIAVTLLVFNLKVPDIEPLQVHKLLPAQLKAMVPHFFAYAMSFLLVAVYWTIHHRVMNRVKHIDSRFIYINLAYLLMVSFMPFPAGLLGSYPHESICLIFYLGCAVVVTMLSLYMWYYASAGYRLIDKDTPPIIIRYFFTRGFTSLGVIIFSLILAVFQVHDAQYLLLLLVPAGWIVNKSYKYDPRLRQMALPGQLEK